MINLRYKHYTDNELAHNTKIFNSLRSQQHTNQFVPNSITSKYVHQNFARFCEPRANTKQHLGI